MQPTDELRYDHEVLRAKLALLEDDLPLLPALRVTVSRLTDSLATCLRAHTEREEQLLDRLGLQDSRRPLPADTLQHLHDAHENQRTHLAILHDLLTQPAPASDARIAAEAASFVEELRQHLTEEERTCFPAVEQEAPGARDLVTLAAEDEQYLGLA